LANAIEIEDDLPLKTALTDDDDDDRIDDVVGQYEAVANDNALLPLTRAPL